MSRAADKAATSPVGGAFELAPIPLYVIVVPCMALLTALAYDELAYALWCEHVTAFFSGMVLQAICILAWLAHAVEAAWVWSTARSLGCGHLASLAWLAQTFLLGFGSTRMMLKRRDRARRAAHKSS